MISAIIRWSINNRFLVLIATLFLTLGGLYSVKMTPVDALPDLSDVQVIIKTSYPGQAPQVLEDQVTYPLTTAMLAMPGAETVRGYSFFGDSYVYIIFNDKTDMYWARSRVLEYLSQVAPKLPANAKPTLGPDATGEGWIYSYVLQDKTGQHDLAELRSLQDWFLKYELQTVEGVSEIATVSGMVKQYQVQIDPAKLRAAARYGLSIKDVQQVISTAVGGMNVGETIEGLERYPINVRYPQDYRDSVVKLQNLPLVTPNGARIALADVADIHYQDGPPMIKTENARPNGWVFVDIDGRDLGSYVQEAQHAVAEQLALPAGYALTWSGQYEYMERAKQRLSVVVPITLAIIMLLLYFSFRRVGEVLIIIATLPLAMVGGLWLMHYLNYNLSIAVGVGFIALAGVAVEIGVIMLVYLNQAWHYRKLDAEEHHQPLSMKDLTEAIGEGAGLRVRPVMMTVLTVIIGLIPIMYGEGTGSEVMQRIAAPMIGGMASALLLTLLVSPAIFKLWKSQELAKH